MCDAFCFIPHECNDFSPAMMAMPLGPAKALHFSSKGQNMRCFRWIAHLRRSIFGFPDFSRNGPPSDIRACQPTAPGAASVIASAGERQTRGDLPARMLIRVRSYRKSETFACAPHAASACVSGTRQRRMTARPQSQIRRQVLNHPLPRWMSSTTHP